MSIDGEGREVEYRVGDRVDVDVADPEGIGMTGTIRALLPDDIYEVDLDGHGPFPHRAAGYEMVKL